MTDEQFDEFLDKCYGELEEKQEKMFSEYYIGVYEEYWFDQLTRTLQFKNNNKVEIEFYIVCIGTWAHQKNTWMWGWANNSFTEEIRREAERLKGLREITGYELFQNEGFDCDETMAYELTAIAINHLNAMGMYKIPGERSHLFVALMEKKLLPF
ncbi:MAG: DUF6882 domain-containing protein [Bacillota bacterium]